MGLFTRRKPAEDPGPPQGASFTFITFGPVTITAADGTTSTSTIDIPEDRP
ncbi:hypothetical protein [Actinoplanes utahensis]|uniref:hypothetical protein n=1 Tax=Actinoplanes utahensis TaxID=1869 RepID=UPI001378941D|nr:hypothetical protein [Actinoplanes utahensis]GIF31633.1 hypothetical protein Aut01nite_46190 [Actinoplanes utahensis]